MKPLGAVLDGKLRLDRLLGAGGMGAVYLATHLALGQRVAVKVLGAEERRSPDSLARFVQEAQVASRITSEHVVRVFDLGQTPEGEPYIVMELLEGEDLASILERERRLPVAAAVHLVLQSCVGVAAAHAAGLVHRDIKPANLFAARRPGGGVVVKVLDFGLSKIAAPDARPGLTQSSATFGTPLYMAPEQIMSAKHVDARCDQHALAMILFELLTGEPPYEGETAGAITVKIATSPPPSARERRADVPASLDRVIQRALAKRPEDRFRDVAALATALAPFAEASDAPLVAAVRDALTPRAAPALADPSTQHDPSTLPLARRPDSHAAVSTSVGARAVGPRGWIAIAAVALSVASAAAWVTVRASAPLRSPRGGAAAIATGDTDDPRGRPAPSTEPSAPTVTAAPAAVLPESAPAAAVSAPATPASSSPRALSPAAAPTTPRRPPRRPAPAARPPASKDPTEVFGAR